MKKKLMLVALVLVFALALSACGCKHETWLDADCETPKTCAECGETEGAPLGHSWFAATCETAKTCETCGKIEGEALGHSWAEATCEAPKSCETCELTEGEALGHSWLEATTETPKTCETCAATEGERIITDSRFTTAATKDIQGKWAHTMEVTGDMMGEPNFEGTMSYSIVLELKNDGTMAMYMVLNDTTALEEYLLDTLYAQFAEAGLDKEAADAAIQQSTGMTMEEYVEYALGMIDFETILGSINYNGVYYVEGDQLYSGLTWEGELTAEQFILEGDTLTLMSDVTGTGESSAVFTRMAE